MSYCDYGYLHTSTIITYYIIPMNIKELAICEVLSCSNQRDIITIDFPRLITHCICQMRSSCLSKEVVVCNCNLKVMWLSRKRDCDACHVRLARNCKIRHTAQTTESWASNEATVCQAVAVVRLVENLL